MGKFFLIFAAFLFVSCASTRQLTVSEPIPDISTMSLEQKIAQMFVVRLESLDSRYTPEQVHHYYEYSSTEITSEIREKFERIPAGGFIIFPKNIVSKKQLKKLTSDIHSLPFRPLVYTDEEGGRVLRLAKVKSLHLKKVQPMGNIGESGKPGLAYKAGNRIGKYLSEYGIDVDFAPVADVNSNPANTVIGDRAFSSNPEVVAEMDKAFLRGLKNNGVESCLKHFPGHGDTDKDTHHGYAETSKDWGQLLECEMVPFKSGIEEGVNFIMSAHISVPKVTGNSNPATVSPVILTEKLRGELGYKNIIITDAMDMGAITKHYNSEQAVVKAVLAGADIILMPFDYEKAFNVLLEAVKNGTISENRIDESVQRILKVKRNSQL